MDAWQPLLDRLTRLRDSWPLPPWTWDGRFNAIASWFTTELEPSARASAMHAFPNGWTTKSLDTAPAPFRALADRTGGLRARQRLLGGGDGLYGLWWPWGGGDKTTLRIGILDVTAGMEPLPRVLALFGVTP